MTDPVGSGKMVRYMQNPSYASVYAVELGTSFGRYESQNSE